MFILQLLGSYGVALGLGFILFIVLAITVHEWAHAWAATKLGDDTPRLMGRLTLDPQAHIDPVGGLLFLIAGFGWGRPVIYNPLRLRHRRDELLIALAGPITNLLLAAVINIVLILIYRFVPATDLATNLIRLLALGSQVNIWLAAFNLLPIPPLDGSSIVAYFFPTFRSIVASQSGVILLLLLLIVPVGGQSLIGMVLSPLISFFTTLTFGNTFIL